jgi:hypothetical protein
MPAVGNLKEELLLIDYSEESSIRWLCVCERESIGQRTIRYVYLVREVLYHWTVVLITRAIEENART